MKLLKTTAWGIALSLLLCMSANLAFANESSVKIEAVDKVEKGREVKIMIHVSHDGNNFIHHSDLVLVRINGEEVKRWEFGYFSNPPAEEFSKEITYSADQKLEIEAKAYCNIHGSDNTARKTIDIIPQQTEN
ncbi:MAG: desulfoferrodoxin family protein [Desulfosudaceae bacterium]